MSLKKSVKISDWNNSKGLARPKNDSLKVLNNYLEHVRGLLSSHYQEFVVNKELVTAEAIKNKFLGIEQQENTLQSLVDYHNLHMKGILAAGTIKNYHTTARYLKEFMLQNLKNRIYTYRN